MLPSELCTDAEFIRRVYLDLVGVPPKPDDVRAFSPKRAIRRVKRDEMIDDWSAAPSSSSMDEQVGRPVAGEPQVPGRRGARGVPQVDSPGVASNMPYDKFAYNDADGEWLERGESARLVLQDAARRRPP